MNLELIYNEISGEDRNKEQMKKRKLKKRSATKKRKRPNEKKSNKDDQESFGNCDPEAVTGKYDCSSEEEDEQAHSDDDDDNMDKIILCDGTIIDADINFNISPLLNTNKLSMITTTIEHSHESDTNHNDDDDEGEIDGEEENDEEEEEEIKNCSRSASIENLETKMDTLSVVSCHSCHDDGECAQRSIDAGYSSETQHEVLLSNNNSSRTSSIVSTPEGSEVACSHLCCNKHKIGDTFLTLEQMLVRNAFKKCMYSQS